MKTIPISSILIPENRQRQEFSDDALVELATSIRNVGLMQPLVLRNDGRTLVAGERRLRAIRDFIYALRRNFQHQGEDFEWDCANVPYVVLGDLDPIALEEAELDENLKRKDLTWQERAAATARLHRLRQSQREEHSVADTATELRGRSDGKNHDIIRKDIILAKHLANPAVANAKSADEAFKILKKQEEGAQHAALAAAIGTSFSKESHAAYQANCLEWMEAYLAEKGELFDVILTDPPYGMGADQFGDAAGKLAGTEHVYDDSYESWQTLLGEWARLSYLITKPQAHAYIFCDFDRFHELKAMMETEGWYVFRTPLLVQKINSGRVPLPEHGPRRTYELILYAIKGWKTVTSIQPDILPHKADEQMGHGAQKPVSLFVDLLQRSVRPGDRVLDTFAGSGPIFPAAHSLKVFATGIEQNPVSYGKCLERLKELK